MSDTIKRKLILSLKTEETKSFISIYFIFLSIAFCESWILIGVTLVGKYIIVYEWRFE